MIDDVLTNGRHFYNPLHNRSVYSGRVSNQLPLWAQYGAPLLPRESSWRQRPAILRHDFRPGGGRQPPTQWTCAAAARAARRFIGWQTFFDFGGPYSADVRPNKRIDTIVSTPLFHLPLGTISQWNAARLADAAQFIKVFDLATPLRSTYRAKRWAFHPLSDAELAELQPIRPSFVTATPLFYYILKEALAKRRRTTPRPCGGADRSRGIYRSAPATP